MNEDVWSAYLDGECDDDERAWVEQQIADGGADSAVLADLRAARDAVRALPQRDAPPEFWARILAEDPHPTSEFEGAFVAGDTDVPTDLAVRRAQRPRHARRWFGAAAAVVVAAVVTAVVLVPGERSVTPPVATFTDAHAVRSSLQDDAISSLAPLAVRSQVGGR
jgi:anti-sigma factor RsiW